MRREVLISAAAVLFCLCAAAQAHFQVLKPSTDVVTLRGDRTVEFDIRFTHPMEQGPVMQVGEPRRFGVIYKGREHDLTDSLKAVEIDGARAYRSSFTVKRPADYVFYLEPAPYWEPVEGKMIVHYTKVVVNGMGAGGGWDVSADLPVEIEPLSRPYGVWTGNVFRGVVRRDGEPVPHAEIEVEYLNEGGEVDIPSSPFVTQVIKADEDGVFTYAMPREGWWGFAALVEGDRKMENPEGEKVPVELGGLIWVKTVDMK